MIVKLTNYEVEQIKKEFFNGARTKDIAKKYGVTPGHISNIIGGNRRMGLNRRKIEGITKISITKGDGYMNIQVHGHNEDSITCAGISAIIQTCELGLKALAENRKNVIIKEYEEDLEEM